MKKMRLHKSDGEIEVKPSAAFINFVKASSLASGMIVTLLIVCWLFFMFIPVGSWVNLVVGESMAPTLNNGQIIFSDFGEVERGDIVTLQLPALGFSDAKKTLVKRVVGMPGDKVLITSTAVCINDVALSEHYLSESAKLKTFADGQINFLVLGENEYFVMGDNRGASTDSRQLGAIKSEDICYVQSETPTLRFWIDLLIMGVLFCVGFLTCTFVENCVTRWLYCMWRKTNRVRQRNIDWIKQNDQNGGEANEN